MNEKLIGGKYELGAMLGSGGTGVVYRAKDAKTGQTVAVKLLNKTFANNPESSKSFEKEAKAWTSLKAVNDNICELIEFGNDDQGLYLVMPYLNGESLGQLLGKPSGVSHLKLVIMLGQALKAVAYAHEKGVIHRNIKPENIFVTKVGDRDDLVKVLDFGTARIVGNGPVEEMIQKGVALDTPQYMSPEQCRGTKETDAKTDLYAFGVILYRALTGQFPFDADDTLALINKIQNDPITPPRELNDEIPESLEAVVLKALARSPKERYQTVEEMAADLQSVQGKLLGETIKRKDGGKIRRTKVPQKALIQNQKTQAPKKEAEMHKQEAEMHKQEAEAPQKPLSKPPTKSTSELPETPSQPNLKQRRRLSIKSRPPAKEAAADSEKKSEQKNSRIPTILGRPSSVPPPPADETKESELKDEATKEKKKTDPEPKEKKFKSAEPKEKKKTDPELKEKKLQSAELEEKKTKNKKLTIKKLGSGSLSQPPRDAAAGIIPKKPGRKKLSSAPLSRFSSKAPSAAAASIEVKKESSLKTKKTLKTPSQEIKEQEPDSTPAVDQAPSEAPLAAKDTKETITKEPEQTVTESPKTEKAPDTAVENDKAQPTPPQAVKDDDVAKEPDTAASTAPQVTTEAVGEPAEEVAQTPSQAPEADTEPEQPQEQQDGSSTTSQTPSDASSPDETPETTTPSNIGETPSAAPLAAETSEVTEAPEAGAASDMGQILSQDQQATDNLLGQSAYPTQETVEQQNQTYEAPYQAQTADYQQAQAYAATAEQAPYQAQTADYQQQQAYAATAEQAPYQAQAGDYQQAQAYQEAPAATPEQPAYQTQGAAAGGTSDIAADSADAALDDSFDDIATTKKSGKVGSIAITLVALAIIAGLGYYLHQTQQQAEQLKLDVEKATTEAKQSAAEITRLKEEAEKAEKARRWFTTGCGDSPTQKGASMCAIPAGPFWRGCNASVDKECYDDEKPYRQLVLDAYYLDQHEVTVQEYEACVDSGQCKTKGLQMPFWDGAKQAEWAWTCNWKKKGRKSHPINCIEWQHALDYCTWVGKRLPTEAEWEKGARGENGQKYPWGDKGFDKKLLVANIGDITLKEKHPDLTTAETYNDSYYTTAPVETYPHGRSPYGMYDMVGNVWEWVSDKWDEGYYPKAPKENPKGPEKGDSHVSRGGSWDIYPALARTSARDGNLATDRFKFLGFRCALSAPNEE